MPNSSPDRTRLEAAVLGAPQGVLPLARRLLFRLPPGSALRRRGVVRVLKLSWEGTNRDDLDFQLAFMSPDVEARFNGAPGIGLRDVYRGHDGVREMTHDWKLDIPDIRFEVLSLEDRGNLLLARVLASGHGATSGVEISNDAGLAYWVAGDGLIHRIDVYWKWEDAVEALGA